MIAQTILVSKSEIGIKMSAPNAPPANQYCQAFFPFPYFLQTMSPMMLPNQPAMTAGIPMVSAEI